MPSGKQCLTHGAVYEIDFGVHSVQCRVLLPPGILAAEADDKLIVRIHDAMEAALAPLFPTYEDGK